jgi:transcriptional regulator with XRE-family HTH domain
LHNSQPIASSHVAQVANDQVALRHYDQAMPVTRIHKSKQPRRPHFIAEWAAKRNLSPTDLAREIGADKSVISRWYSGTSPSVEYQEKLAALFGCEPEAIFRHPDDDWIARFFRDRSLDELKRMQQMLEAAFPRKTGTKDK